MATYYSDFCDKVSFVYRLYDCDGALLYVGLALTPMNRISRHRSKPWGHRIASWTCTPYPNRWSALDAENRAIATENPLHNIYRPKGGVA